LKICLDGCKEKFNRILSGVLNGGNQDAHKMEALIFNQLIKLGFILMQCKNSVNHFSKKILKKLQAKIFPWN